MLSLTTSFETMWILCYREKVLRNFQAWISSRFYHFYGKKMQSEKKYPNAISRFHLIPRDYLSHKDQRKLISCFLLAKNVLMWFLTTSKLRYLPIRKCLVSFEHVYFGGWSKKKNVNRICEKTCLTGSVLSLADDWFGEHSSTSTQKYPVLIYHEFWNWFRVIMKRGPRQSSEKSDHNNIKCTQTMHHNRRVRFRQHLWFLITRKKYCDKTMMMMTMKKTKKWADGRGGGVKDRSMLKCIANIMQMLTLTRISSQISKYISFFTYRRKKNNRHTQTVHFFLSIRYVIRTYHNLK